MGDLGVVRVLSLLFGLPADSESVVGEADVDVLLAKSRKLGEDGDSVLFKEGGGSKESPRKVGTASVVWVCGSQGLVQEKGQFAPPTPLVVISMRG